GPSPIKGQPRPQRRHIDSPLSGNDRGAPGRHTPAGGGADRHGSFPVSRNRPMPSPGRVTAPEQQPKKGLSRVDEAMEARRAAERRPGLCQPWLFLAAPTCSQACSLAALELILDEPRVSHRPPSAATSTVAAGPAPANGPTFHWPRPTVPFASFS